MSASHNRHVAKGQRQGACLLARVRQSKINVNNWTRQSRPTLRSKSSQHLQQPHLCAFILKGHLIQVRHDSRNFPCQPQQDVHQRTTPRETAQTYSSTLHILYMKTGLHETRYAFLRGAFCGATAWKSQVRTPRLTFFSGKNAPTLPLLASFPLAGHSWKLICSPTRVDYFLTRYRQLHKPRTHLDVSLSALHHLLDEVEPGRFHGHDHRISNVHTYILVAVSLNPPARLLHHDYQENKRAHEEIRHTSQQPTPSILHVAPSIDGPEWRTSTPESEADITCSKKAEIEPQKQQTPD